MQPLVGRTAVPSTLRTPLEHDNNDDYDDEVADKRVVHVNRLKCTALKAE